MLNVVVDVHVNGAAEDLATGTTVAQVVERWCPSPDGVAVARNGDVVPRSAWADTSVEAGDRLEIVTAAAGG
jgi:sulfur carrier protein